MTKPDSTDFIAALGLVLVVAGIAMIHRPAAVISAGLLLFAYAWLASRIKPKANSRQTTTSSQG